MTAAESPRPPRPVPALGETPRRWPQRGYSRLLRTTLFRLHARRQRPQAGRQWRSLRQLERESADRVAALQCERLRRHLLWACQASPYYRTQAQQAGLDPAAVRRISDLERFPILSKPMLRQYAEELLPGGKAQPGWQMNASGGSTGEPVRLYQDDSYWNAAQAAQWFMESWWGVRPGEATAVVWGADRDLASRSGRERLVDWLQQTRALNAFRVEEEELLGFARMLARWKPPLLAGYATGLHLLARFLQRHPHLHYRPRAIKSTAEVLRPEERRLIEETLAAPVFDFYGSREVNNLAAECPAHQGLHVNTWGRVLELVDGEGRAVAPGQPGRVLVTDLTNRATPIIRYENGDIGTWSRSECACRRPFPLLARIEGRKSDFIHTPSGPLIHGEFFTHLFYPRKEVETFQVVQTSLTRVRVDLVLRSGQLADTVAALEPAMQRALGAGVTIAFQRVAAIERGPSGKHHFTRSELSLPWPEAATAQAGSDGVVNP